MLDLYILFIPLLLRREDMIPKLPSFLLKVGLSCTCARDSLVADHVIFAYLRAFVSGWICYGGNRSCWYLPGCTCIRWGGVSGWKKEHKQVVRWGCLLREDIQITWVSEGACELCVYVHVCVACLWLPVGFVVLHRNMACSVAGITSDANVLTTYLREAAQKCVCV